MKLKYDYIEIIIILITYAIANGISIADKTLVPPFCLQRFSSSFSDRFLFSSFILLILFLAYEIYNLLKKIPKNIPTIIHIYTRLDGVIVIKIV